MMLLAKTALSIRLHSSLLSSPSSLSVTRCLRSITPTFLPQQEVHCAFSVSLLLLLPRHCYRRALRVAFQPQQRRNLHASQVIMAVTTTPTTTMTQEHQQQQQQQQHHHRQHHHSADLARMMIPSDANVAGNVHGGTIMQLMEEAAGVVANRYLNSSNNQVAFSSSSPVYALLARVEHVTFQHPVHVGDVAQVHAQVVFGAAHCIAVSVQVTAEHMAWSSSNAKNGKNNNPRHREETVCNRALMWLVGVVLPDDPQRTSPQQQQPSPIRRINPQRDFQRARAPPFPIPNPETNPQLWRDYQMAQQLYLSRKETTALFGDPSDDDFAAANDSLDEEEEEQVLSQTSEKMNANEATHICFTPDYSAVELVQVMQPSDSTTQCGLVSGGVVMKLMDNACGVAAVRHCGTNVVTVSVDCVNFVAPVLVGDVLKVRARPTFTSNKTLELSVRVVVERFADDNNHHNNNSLSRYDIVTTERAYFSFVSLPLRPSDDGSSSSSLPMRPLVLQTKEDYAHFEQGQRRYERRQNLRRQQQQKQQQQNDQNKDPDNLANHRKLPNPHSRL